MPITFDTLRGFEDCLTLLCAVSLMAGASTSFSVRKLDGGRLLPWNAVALALSLLAAWHLGALAIPFSSQSWILTSVRAVLLAGAGMALFEVALALQWRRGAPVWARIVWAALPPACAAAALVTVSPGLGAAAADDRLTAALCVGLALPAAAWTAWGLWAVGATWRAARGGLRLAALGILAFGGLAALGALSPFLPFFNPLLTHPLLVLASAAAAAALAAGLWRARGALFGMKGLEAAYRREIHSLAFLLAFMGVIVACGWLAADAAERRWDAAQREALLRQARVGAALLSAEDAASLRGEPSDMKAAPWRRLHESLARVRQDAPGIRFAYLMGLRGGKAVFLVDGDPEGGRDFSPPGQVYDEAAPELLAALAQGTPRTDGPAPDRWGVWVTGMAPVPGAPQAQLGLDIDAHGWIMGLAHARFWPLMVAAMLAAATGIAMAARAMGCMGAAMLADSEARHRALFEQSTDGVLLMSEVFLDCNAAACAMFGARREDILGRAPWDFSPRLQDDGAESRATALGHVRAALAGEPRRFAWTHLRADGVRQDVEVSLSPVTLGKRHLVQAVMRDVTEVRKAERALRASERRLARAQQVAHVGNWEMDSETLTLWASDEALRIWGLEADAGGRLGLSQVRSLVQPEDRPALDAALEALTDHGRSMELSLRLRRQGDGALRTVKVAAEAAPAQGGTPQVHGIVQDITESARVEERLRQAEKMEGIGQLAGGIAHDFNNMLAPIIGYGEIAQIKAAQGQGVEEELRLIGQAAERAAGLTRQVMAISRRQALNLQPLDLNQALRRMEPLLRELAAPGVRLEMHTPAAPCPALADAQQLEQVTLNLAANASEAMPSGGTLVVETGAAELDRDYVAKHPEASAGRFVMLAVTDTGVGMDKATLARVFEPFFTTKERRDGAGLGLPTVYGIVRQHGGFISVSSEPGKGTTLRVFLPRFDGGAPEARHAAEAEAPGEAPRGVETILVVEDEPMVLSLTARMLAVQGYTVLTAADGPSALGLAADHRGPIHLLLADLAMPAQGGVDLAAELTRQRPGLRVLFMTGHSHDDAGVRAPLAESATLRKPFHLAQLARRVREALDAPAAEA